MTPVFADSQFWIALANPRDQWHERAVAAFATLDRPILTTRFILLEVAAALARATLRGRYGELIDRLAEYPDVTILPLTDDDFDAGEELYRDRPDKDWSLTNDHHFEQAGFIALLK